jgi:hypothetical protein
MTLRSEMKKQSALVALAAILFGITVQPVVYSAPKRSSAGAPRLTASPARLGTVAEFKAAFQNDQGKVRLVALVSPT